MLIFPVLCDVDHSIASGLQVPESMAPSSAIQASPLPNLPVEIILIIFDALKTDPVAQVSLAMSCKPFLEISTMAKIRSCCMIKPGSARRFRLLGYIYPRIISADGTSHRSLEWHVCQKCEKFRPTSVAYWVKKREAVQFANDAVSHGVWRDAVANFSRKDSRNCPECAMGHGKAS
ncbi:hypothetical protein BJX64DRAFT_295140 [Aspergillus heterothallicus]